MIKKIFLINKYIQIKYILFIFRFWYWKGLIYKIYKQNKLQKKLTKIKKNHNVHIFKLNYYKITIFNSFKNYFKVRDHIRIYA